MPRPRAGGVAYCEIKVMETIRRRVARGLFSLARFTESLVGDLWMNVTTRGPVYFKAKRGKNRDAHDFETVAHSTASKIVRLVKPTRDDVVFVLGAWMAPSHGPLPGKKRGQKSRRVHQLDPFLGENIRNRLEYRVGIAGSETGQHLKKQSIRTKNAKDLLVLDSSRHDGTVGSRLLEDPHTPAELS